MNGVKVLERERSRLQVGALFYEDFSSKHITPVKAGKRVIEKASADA